MLVNRAIYEDGWIACSRFGVHWTTAGKEGDFLDAPWELCNIDKDFSQSEDIAADNADKLKQLKARLVEEALNARRIRDVMPLGSPCLVCVTGGTD